MSQIHRMTVAIDLDDTAEAVLRDAAWLAARLDANVHLLYVDFPPAVSLRVGSYPLGMSARQWHRRARARHRRELEQVVEQHFAGARHVLPLLAKDRQPARAIVEQADATGADLIVVGKNRRTWPSTWLRGRSTTELVALRASCPVLAVGAASPSLADGVRVLAATRPGDAVLGEASRYATAIEAPLTVAHLVSVREVELVERAAQALGGGPLRNLGSREALLQQLVEEPTAPVDEIRLPISSGYRMGTSICGVAQEIDAGLIVVGHQERWWPLEHLRASTAAAVLRHTNRSVLVVPAVVASTPVPASDSTHDIRSAAAA